MTAFESEEWYDVDNVSKVFLAAYNRRDTRCIRISCTLNEAIDPLLLQQALDQTVLVMPQFQVRIHRGLFWHYMEHIDASAQVTEEDGIICPLLYGSSYKGLLHYRVTYYKNRINFESFHALTDGTGGIEFIRILTGNYLKLAHPDVLADYLPVTASTQEEKEEDSFEQNYDKDLVTRFKSGDDTGNAYQIHGRKLPYEQLQYFEIHTDASKLLALAKSCGCTITSYISALQMQAIYADMPVSKKGKQIAISIPVNLRKFYGSHTSRNFFNSVKIRHTFTHPISTAELAQELDQQLRASLDEDLVRQRMSEYSRVQHMVFTRMVPLALKQPVVRYFTKKQGKTNSATVSNLGVLKPDAVLSPYIAGYSLYCSTDSFFTTVGSFGNDLFLGICYAYENTRVLRNFVKLLHDEGLELTVDATEVLRK